jgi:hypothetical protein
MDLNTALDALGFLQSPKYVAAEQFRKLQFGKSRSHIFRKAISSCSLRGVYFLDRQDEDQDPIVFVTEAPDTENAFAIYKKVWNQNVVPLLLVNTPEGLHLFYSFQAPSDSRESRSNTVAAVARTIDEVSRQLKVAHAASIDSGKIWANKLLSASPKGRVDYTLLSYLDRLVKRLRDEGVDPKLSYAMIGKLLFLRYLRHRDILSDQKFQEFELDEQHSMGEHLRLSDLGKLVSRTEAWLGVEVFPFDLAGVREEHIKLVATTLLGDDPQTGQTDPRFSLFEFGFIPIETLSSVYQRLLHSTGHGREIGAYYTPSSLIEFVLGEVQDVHPLTTQTTILDPSCGSGAFLVHCFRLLVERFLEEHGSITPTQLRSLLKERVFGVDRDAGACRVAQLSLLLTMLDYIQPSDLLGDPTFRLPELFNHNIIQADFFACENKLVTIPGNKFDWVVGNPPWVEVNGERAGLEDQPVLDWLRRNDKEFPVASNQVAEAFVWKSALHCSPGGAVGLVLPAISLFKDNTKFWHALTQRYRISSVANFSSFAKVLFEHAKTAPFVLTLQPRPALAEDDTLIFSPLLLNQPELSAGDSSMPPLSITVNRSEVRSVPSRSLTGLSPARWKALVISGLRDARLLGQMERSFPTLQHWLDQHNLMILEGPQLRGEESREKKRFVDELVDKPILATEGLRQQGQGRLHRFPAEALDRVPRSGAYLRLRGGEKGLAVCRPPHVIVSASLSFAVFSDEFIIVPPRQIGISGDDPDLLRMLSLFLSSSFVTYQQFFASPQGGVRGGRTTLESLRRIPCPLGEVSPKKRQAWLDLQQRKAKQMYGPIRDPEIDQLVFAALGLDEQQTALVEDFVQVSLQLTYGDIQGSGAQVPTHEQLSAYAKWLKRSLDMHISSKGLKHYVKVSLGSLYGAVRIGLVSGTGSAQVDSMGELPELSIYESGADPQWIYFDRNLLVSHENEVFLFKPLQLFWWTRARALADCDQISATVLDSEISNGSERIY